MVIRLVSTVCAASLLTGLLAASPIAPQVAARQSFTGSGAPALGTGGTATEVPGIATPGANGPLGPDGGLKARTPFPKLSSKLIELPVHQDTGKPTWNGRLIVKFRDELKARADMVPGMFVRNRLGEPIPEVSEILAVLDGTVRSAMRHSPSALRDLERRAEARTGRAQPDLGGLVYVDVRPEQLLAAARAFNDLDIVEYVEIETTPEQHRQNFSSQFGCGAVGENAAPLTAGVNNCFTSSVPPSANPNAARCSALGGGGGCNDVGACAADIVLPICRSGCNDGACCTLIAGCLPGCSDTEQGQGWDALCATYANVLCAQLGSIYDGGPPRGSPDGTPNQYKYDPCFAMRGAFIPPDAPAGPSGFPEGGPLRIQGQLVAPNEPNLLSGGLMRYDLSPNGQFFPGVNELKRVDYDPLAPATPGNITAEADPDSGVPQRAMVDPSLEGAGQLLAGGCFTPHASGGCNQVTCCVYVCRTDPSCCIIEWDDNCVSLATSAPEPTPGSPAALAGLGSPCTTNRLPSTDGATPPAPAFPPAGPTPLLTGGVERNLVTNAPIAARGYQTYGISLPALDPFTSPLAVQSPVTGSYPVVPPTEFTPSPTTPAEEEAARRNQNGNLGTLAWLNCGYRGGGLDLAGYDDLLVQLGVNPLVAGHGQNTTVAVIDLSAYVDHEDLKDHVRGEQGQTQVLIDQDPMDPDHGTAVLGVIGAKDNDFGVTGIAYAATLNFYPAVSVEEGERLIAAITSALIDLGEGDVICMPIGSNGNAIVSQPTVNLLVGVGTGAGITTVCSAGNIGVGINQGLADSGAIIVSACWPGYRIGAAPSFSAVPGGNAQGGLPGFNYCRFQQSNYEPEEGLPGVQASTVSAWGTGVATCGYGDLFQGDAPSSDPLQVNKLRTYTAGESFEGTSAAAAIIAGWCSRLQSFSLAYFGTALPVPDLRNALQTPGNYFQQCGLAYDAQQFPGYPENCEQYGDIIAGGEQARIGGFPRARNTVAWLVANAFSGANPVTFDIITGTYQAGGAFSLREVDDITLRIAAQRRRAGNKGQGFGSALFYPLTGGTTDLQLSVTASSPPSQVTAFVLQTRSRVSWNLPVIEIVYFYNFTQNRWVPSGYVALSAAYGGGTYPPVGDPRDFMRPSTGNGTQIFARVYTCGLTGAGYTVLHDQLNFVIDVDIFDTGGGNSP